MRRLGVIAAALASLMLSQLPSSAFAQCASPPTLIDSVTPPPGTSPGDYVASFLAVGDAYYTDVAPTLEGIPPELDCAHWIETRHADSAATDAVFLEFTVLEDVEVYVLYDSRVALQADRSPPDWLTSAFTLTNLMVDVDASAVGPLDSDQEFVAYRKIFAAGTVSLGANGATGADFVGADGTENAQYVVAVTRPAPPLPSPSCAVSPVLIGTIAPPPGRTSPPDYVAASLAAGSEYYTDRGPTHTLTELGPDVFCADWLKTRNDDKARQDASLPTLDVSQDAVVYIAYDARIALQGECVPDWITTDYTYTHRYVDIAEPDADQEFVLYTRSVGPGTVVLGGNRASPCPADSFSNYVVAVVPDTDADGVADTIDNCVNDPNPEQQDSDVDGLGDPCDPCTLLDDPGQDTWDPVGPPPEFDVCLLAVENGLTFRGLQARDDHVFVMDLTNFPLRPQLAFETTNPDGTPTTPGDVSSPKVEDCDTDPLEPTRWDVGSPDNNFLQGPNDDPEIWKGYSSADSRDGTRCIVKIAAKPASAVPYDLALSVEATTPNADPRDTAATSFTAASEDFDTEGTNHRWIYRGTAGLGECLPLPLTAALENPGETNEGPAEATYAQETVPAQNDVFDCCTFTFDSVDGVRAIPAAEEFPIGTPVVPLDDTDGDFYPDLCDLCPNDQDLQIDTDEDGIGDVCDPFPMPEPGRGPLLAAGILTLLVLARLRQRRSRLGVT